MSTAINYTNRIKIEYYGTNMGKPGSKGYSKYAWCKNEDCDPLSEEEAKIFGKIRQEVYGPHQEKVAFLANALAHNEITEQEFNELSKITPEEAIECSKKSDKLCEKRLHFIPFKGTLLIDCAFNPKE